VKWIHLIVPYRRDR